MVPNPRLIDRVPKPELMARDPKPVLLARVPKPELMARDPKPVLMPALVGGRAGMAMLPGVMIVSTPLLVIVGPATS